MDHFPWPIRESAVQSGEWWVESGLASDLKFNLKCISLFTVIISTHLWMPVPQFNLQNIHSIALKRDLPLDLCVCPGQRSRRRRTSQDQFRFQFFSSSLFRMHQVQYFNELSLLLLSVLLWPLLLLRLLLQPSLTSEQRRLRLRLLRFFAWSKLK